MCQCVCRVPGRLCHGLFSLSFISTYQHNLISLWHQVTQDIIIMWHRSRSKDKVVIGVAKHMEYAARDGYLAQELGWDWGYN